jgi:hypothetical protein
MSDVACFEDKKDETNVGRVPSRHADTTSTSTAPEFPKVRRVPARRVSKSVDGAVFSYIKAVRALGRTRINTADIAVALRLPMREVDRAVGRLAGKGVKIIE